MDGIEMGFLNSLMGMPDPEQERRPGSFLMDLIAAQPAPRQPRPGGGPGPVSGVDGELNPTLQKLLQRLPWLDVVSGVRSTEHQAELWQQALAKYGDPEIADNWVARPGHSQHEQGNAIDVAREDIARLNQFLASHQKWNNRVGFPLSNEDWHLQPQSTY